MNLKKFLITMGILLILGGFISDAIQFIKLFKKDPNEVIFEVPGSATFSAPKAGKYTLWHHYETLHQGEIIRNEELLPNGTRISISDESENPIPLTSDMSSSSSTGNYSKVSIGSITLDSPQTINILVSSDNEKRILSMSENSFLKHFLTLFIVTFFTFIPGIGLVIWGMLIKSPSTPPPLPPQ
ncbi:hypothetical protein ACFPK9_03620 [Rubritalea spongiae]|uniref:DUF3592 domain-containing protein n=1 Tax=Rubritalea spongiae TaxID=430797 RepID=A0ABW5E5Y5_9BACT